MSNGFHAQCPHCQAKLAVNNPQLVGKTVRCPKCSQTFVVTQPGGQAPAATPATPTAPSNDPFGGVPSNDPFGGLPSDAGFPAAGGGLPGDPLATDPLATPAPSARPQAGAGRARRRRGGGGAPAWLKPVLIGAGGVAGVALLIFLLMMLMGGSSKNVVDMTYLPENTDLLVHVDLQSVVNTAQFKEQLESPMYSQQIKLAEEKTGLTVRDLDTLTIGVPGGSGAREPLSSDKVIGVLRLKKDLDEAKIVASGLKSEDHAGKKLYNDGTGQFALYLPDPRTLVVGSVEAVKQASAQTEEPRFEKFDFVNKRQDMFVGWVPSDTSFFSQFSNQMPMGNPLLGAASDDVKTLAEVLGNNMRGFAAGADAGSSNARITVQALCDSSAASGKLKGALSGLISEGKKQYKEQKKNMPADPPEAIREMIKTADAMVNSLKVKKSGDSVMLSISVPQSQAFEQAMRSSPIPGLGRSPFGSSPFGGSSSSSSFGSGGSSRASTSMSDRNNLKQILLAMHNYHDTYKTFPPQRTGSNGSERATNLSWRVHLLPFLEENALYDQFHLDEPWNSPHNIRLVNRMPRVFKHSGSRASNGKATILAIDMPGSVFEGNAGAQIREIIDGTSNTAAIVMVEDSYAVEWTRPSDYRPPAGAPGRGLYARGSDRTTVGLCDGSVADVPKSNSQFLNILFQMNDKQPTDFP